MRAWRRVHGSATGLVPTMGYLHEGHLSLVRRARSENQLLITSLFINPTQFGPGEDFERYPRDEERDLSLLREASVDAVYMPTGDSMYGPGYQTYIQMEEMTRRLEGDRRPIHFRGVTTIVLKLFNATTPDRAYFGRKDAQQLRVIQRLVTDLDLGVTVVPCDIIREPDGLAMSSRNVYLSEEERTSAPAINRALRAAKAAFGVGEQDAAALRDMVRDQLSVIPGSEVDYVSLADDVSLDEIDGQIRSAVLLSVAVKFGQVRLLDNVELDPGTRGRT